MAKMTVTLKIKYFKLMSYIRLMQLVSFVSERLTYKMLDWLKENIDKFYTIKM